VIPVVYSQASQAIVDAYIAQAKTQQSAAYWADSAIAGLKKEIKDHYIAQQGRRCAYCRHSIYTNNNAVWDAEHVISKRKDPEFMFEPRNLAISCKDCNIAKGEQEVRNTKKAAFPETSPEYKIVHPHFDDYDAHIGWMGSVCFARSTDKGSKTIAMCNLTRYSAMRIGETENIMIDDFNRLMGQLMEAKSETQGKVIVAGILEILKSKTP
jgi:uncharacterized protein (TIGR02646 family)